MRTLPLLAGTMLLLALVSTAPGGAAAAQRCSSLVHPDCPGLHCVDENGDRRFDAWECTDRLLDPCLFMSDCCGWGGFWCPDRE